MMGLALAVKFRIIVLIMIIAAHHALAVIVRMIA